EACTFLILNPLIVQAYAPNTAPHQFPARRSTDLSGGPDSGKDVTLNTSGSATGGGLVDIVNGVGTNNISDQVAQTVNLSLSDSQTTGFNVSSVQDVIFAHGTATKFVIRSEEDRVGDERRTVR